MKKGMTLVVAVAVAALLVTGGLIASNMGFKLNYTLEGPGSSQTGTNTLGLPFNKMTGLANAKDLIDDINNTGAPTGKVVNVQQFNRANDSYVVYNGVTGAPFTLTDGHAVRVQVSADVQYIVVGSHNPGLAIDLLATGVGSQSGTNLAAIPYHTTADNAKDLIDEVNALVPGSVVNVQQFNNANDSFIVYNGVTGSAFAWAAGEGVVFQMSQNVNWVPAHF
jgi:hypothetical protein